MTRTRTGLVIGKFYPPHAGHHLLIRQAAGEVESLLVLVMASAAETTPLADRVAWLADEHSDDSRVQVIGVRCDAPLDLDDDQVWYAQTALMKAAARQAGADRIDLVATGEAYGRRLAAELGATWMPVPRVGGFPSGTQIRAELASHWEALAPATRAGLAVRVVVLGAESTGTTTLAVALADHYRSRGGVWASTQYVPEYGRELTERKSAQLAALAAESGLSAPDVNDITWQRDDFDAVAAEQTLREEGAARVGSPVLVCDTDALATVVWERRYLAPRHRERPEWSHAPLLPLHDVYLLTHHEDVPWHDDGLREGDLEIRAAMTRWFEDLLTARGHSWVKLTGSHARRLDVAVRTVDQLLAVRARFGSPYSGPGFTGDGDCGAPDDGASPVTQGGDSCRCEGHPSG